MVKWLDRKIAAPGPYLCLVLSEHDYMAAMAHCRITRPDPWVQAPSHARTYVLDHPERGLMTVIGLRDWEGRDPIEVAGLLVHEAVHVWQEYADHIGERRPAVEQEAYAIQAISQELMEDFGRQVAMCPAFGNNQASKDG